MIKVPFNTITYSGAEIDTMRDAANRGQLSGGGHYSKLCSKFIQEKMRAQAVFLTTSCSHALELAASLLNLQPNDEIIIPSYNFVTSASSFVAKGARIVWADSREDHPNIDINVLDQLVSPRTKALIIVHYGGVDAGGEAIRKWCDRRGIVLVEDAAHGYGASDANGKPLGSFGHMSTFSFHDSKNITCGEGGALVLNDDSFVNRAAILYEKGTNRSNFQRGEVSYYEWIDLGASYTLSELNASFLWAQLQAEPGWTQQRKASWKFYLDQLSESSLFDVVGTEELNHNAHNFCIRVKNPDNLNACLEHLKNKGIQALTHYRCLHKSAYVAKTSTIPHLPHCEHWENTLIRLPIHNSINNEQLMAVVSALRNFTC
jgi:dTDP-4-amino-4,6-dideoxygalactose transaminase